MYASVKADMVAILVQVVSADEGLESVALMECSHVAD